MTQKPVWWMVTFGVIRHLLGIAGTWLVSRGLIDDDTHQRLLSEGVTDVMGWLMIVGVFGWSAFQKSQVWKWIQTALHLPAGTPPEHVPVKAPGPNIPV